MQKLKLKAISLLCCCSHEEENTPQPTVTRETRSNPNGVHYDSGPKSTVKLEVCEYKPETPKIHRFPYYCPICFRYFNKMLKSVCCNNYVCELCSKDLKEKETKCPYCSREPLVLKSVESDEIIKKYTDSPFLEKLTKPVKKPADHRKSRFLSKDPEKFTLNDVLQLQKEKAIAELLERTLNSHSQSEGFIRVFPHQTSKGKVVALDPSAEQAEQMIRDFRQFKSRMDNLVCEQSKNPGAIILKRPPESRQGRISRFLSLN